jgi:hypothetical protein
MSRLIEALKLTGWRRFALRAVASCRYAGERQRRSSADVYSGPCPLWVLAFSNSGRALALPATHAAVGLPLFYGRRQI